MALSSFVNILTIVVVLVMILPSQLDAYYTQNTGCHHNGSWYADKSLVPTTEKCLNCQCLKKTLVCRLKVCPEMPMPPPRGCVVVEKRNTCCPYLSCARLDAFYKIPATRRIIAYLDHYERESIDRVVNENMLQRRSDDNDVDLYVCVKNGTVYKSGSAMSSSNLCSYCYCIGGTEKCVKPKCMLPVEGCKPIFVDTTCCPVRYDCSTKQTGKSSQEVRYRKTSNKHYMRMSQRLQRNRGCIVGDKFYAEGQKMKTDKDRLCDICFCIRGQRKCAPKKCAPVLRNCIPVVPKGQCCPSSYDCGSQRDYRRAQNSRQFNLYSLLFGKDEEQEENSATEIAVEYPHDRDPANLKPTSLAGLSTEKSIYDTIREGLEFIDNNNNQMIKDNMDLVDIVKQSEHPPSPTPIPLNVVQMPSTTEVSFFDLLLGPSDPNGLKHKNSLEKLEKESIEEKTTPTSSSLSWVDLLLGPSEDDLKTSASTISAKIYKTDTPQIQDNTDFGSTISIDRVDHDIFTDSAELLGNQQDEQWTSTTDATNIAAESLSTDDTTQTLPTTLAETTEETKATEVDIPDVIITTKKPSIKLTTTTAKPVAKLSTSTQEPYKAIETLNQKTEFLHKNENLSPIKTQIHIKNTTLPQPDKSSDFLTAFWNGLSNILEGENKTRLTTNVAPIKSNPSKTSVQKLSTTKPLPIFKPLPLDKTYTRINSKIANLTVRPPILNIKDNMNTTFKPMPLTTSKNPIIPLTESLETAAPAKTTTSTSTTTTTAKPSVSTSLNPVVIETNPTIFEAESLDENSEHTLPPSLPNLKIIPFLPTDAVEADRNQPSSYEFYHHSSGPISRVDYDIYDDANVYPSITEKYPLYPDLEDGSKAEYIYKFNVEGPDSMVSSTAGKFEGTLGSPAFLKYDFTGSGLTPSTKGFSPPTKTEGGFVPKEPLNLADDDRENVSVNVGDSYQLTEHLIDITTSGDVLNTTKIIEITTPDPFKDVIRTELPPDLSSLIEDKLKNLNIQSNKTTTTASQANDKPQTYPNIELNTKQAETNQLNNKTTNTQIKVTHLEDSNINGNKSKHIGGHEHIRQSIAYAHDTDNDDVVDVKAIDVSTIPPLGSLPQAIAKQKQNTTKAMLAAEKRSTMKLKQNQTISMPTMTTTTTTRRPITLKANRTKTIATNSLSRTKTQQKLTKTKNSTSTSNNSETRVLTSSLSASAGTVPTLKTKSNATRRVTSPKPTKHYKPNNRPTTTITATTPRTTKSTSKPNAINIDITSAATRRTTEPTMTYKKPTITSKPKISTTTTKTTTTKPTSSGTMSSATASSSTSLKTTTNPFFMSPFDKLPFMDASFEVKRNSATPPSFTSSKQHFAVAANIAAATTMLDGENDENENDGDSSMHKLMGLVHYKHTLNQLEGFEPSTQRPQHSSVSSSFSSFSDQSSVSASSSSSSSSQPQNSSPSSSLNNLIDPTGILKLAGCNIYGRMYRVGRIILELSSPCLECKCTEIGVKCGPLDC